MRSFPLCLFQSQHAFGCDSLSDAKTHLLSRKRHVTLVPTSVWVLRPLCSVSLILQDVTLFWFSSYARVQESSDYL